MSLIYLPVSLMILDTRNGEKAIEFYSDEGDALILISAGGTL